jgi:hypothetical protein
MASPISQGSFPNFIFPLLIWFDEKNEERSEERAEGRKKVENGDGSKERRKNYDI